MTHTRPYVVLGFLAATVVSFAAMGVTAFSVLLDRLMGRHP